jgi:Uma2 family endonuclease
MPVLTEHRFNVRAYYRMAESGVFPPDARVELLNGKVVDRSPIGPAHGGTVKQLSRLFNLLARGRWLVSTQDPVRLDDHSEPEPDVALLKTADDHYKTRHPGPDEVYLLIEVSDSTLDYDREEKLPAYGRAGVAEVWIVNLNAATLEVYREPHFTGYAVKTVLGPGDQAAPVAFADAVVSVGELLRR